MLFSFFFWRWFISNAEALKNKQGCLLQNFHSKHSDSFIFELSQKKQQFREGKSENNWISFPSCSKTQNRAVWHQSPISTLNILISFWSSDNKYLEKEISGGFSPPPPPGAFLSANIQRDSHAKCTGRFPCWGKTHALILFYGGQTIASVLDSSPWAAWDDSAACFFHSWELNILSTVPTPKPGHTPFLLLLVAGQSLSHVWLFVTPCSMPYASLLCSLPGFAQIHLHWVSDPI